MAAFEVEALPLVEKPWTSFGCMKHDAPTRRSNINPIVLVGLLWPTFMVLICIAVVLVLVIFMGRWRRWNVSTKVIWIL